jgi:hypothetical protein
MVLFCLLGFVGDTGGTSTNIYGKLNVVSQKRATYRRSRSDEAWLEKFDGDLATSDKKGRIL